MQIFNYLRSTRRGGARHGEQGGKGVIEMKRSDWSDLRQESYNETEAPDKIIPDSRSIDVVFRLRSMVNVS